MAGAVRRGSARRHGVRRGARHLERSRTRRAAAAYGPLSTLCWRRLRGCAAAPGPGRSTSPSARARPGLRRLAQPVLPAVARRRSRCPRSRCRCARRSGSPPAPAGVPRRRVPRRPGPGACSSSRPRRWPSISRCRSCSSAPSPTRPTRCAGWATSAASASGWRSRPSAGGSPGSCTTPPSSACTPRICSSARCRAASSARRSHRRARRRRAGVRGLGHGHEPRRAALAARGPAARRGAARARRGAVGGGAPRSRSRGARRLPPLVGAHVYRIGCEAITNALRHADATAIDIELGGAAAPAAAVGDDGRGLPQERATARTA